MPSFVKSGPMVQERSQKVKSLQTDGQTDGHQAKSVQKSLLYKILQSHYLQDQPQKFVLLLSSWTPHQVVSILLQIIHRQQHIPAQGLDVTVCLVYLPKSILK